MKLRTVSRLLYAEQVDMGGMPIRQPLPTQAVEQIDPFLLLHHANIKAPAHVNPDHAGVGPHPHRGFSPVTFILILQLKIKWTCQFIFRFRQGMFHL
jgi:redox-sensitive bicupin YhaK (pirin superfamily)